MSETDIVMIRKCYEIAKKALKRGNQPYGAILFVKNKIVKTAENKVNIHGDNTRHVELVLASWAMRNLNLEVLSDSVLYSSTEPCAMCAGAIYWARIPRVVFGVSIGSVSSLKEETLMMSCRDVFASGKHTVDVSGPILEDEGMNIHRSYWAKKSL